MLRSFATASALIVLVAAPLGAQPVTRPEMRAEMCGVTFVRAPDDVRYVIEQWLQAEPRCSSTIELRVVPTEDGLYLLAQRPDGRIHERLVPDAQSAGVLVASWVADDWTAPIAAAEPPPPAGPIETSSVDAHDSPRRGPGSIGVTAVAQPRARHRGNWLSLGMMYQADRDAGGGLRAEADLLSLGAWRLGGVLSYTESDYNLMASGWDYGTLTAMDLKIMANLSRTWVWGRWELRGGVGVGALTTVAEVEGGTYSSSAPMDAYQRGSSQTTSAALELSGLVTRRLGGAWGLGVGPVVTFGGLQESSPGIQQVRRDATTVMLFGGLRYEL